MPKKNVDWARWDQVLGWMPDNRIAEIIGINQESVSRHRRELRLPSYAERMSQLFEQGPAKIRKIRGRIGHQRSYNLRWRIAAPFLGKVPDAMIAAYMGVTATTVAYRRQAEQRPLCYRNMTPGARGNESRRRWNPRFNSLLGKVPDAEVAKRAGLTRCIVTFRRRAQGIAAYDGHRQQAS